MKYICPVCGKIVDPRTDNAYKIKTRHERHLTMVHIRCYQELKKRGAK